MSSMKDVQRAFLERYCTALEAYGVAVRNFAASLRLGDELAIKSARGKLIAARLKCVKRIRFLRLAIGRRH
jgi:hypothetical protein